MSRNGKEEMAAQPQSEPRQQPARPVLSESLSAAFEEAVLGVSTRTALPMSDIRAAYEDKPQSLTTVFEAMKNEKSDMNSWIGWSVAWLILLPPIMLYTGYKAFESYCNLEDLKNQVKAEVNNEQGERAVTVPEANGPSAP